MSKNAAHRRVKTLKDRVSVRVVAYRAVFGWRDRLLILTTGKVALITKMTVPRWIPDPKYEAQFRVGVRTGDVACSRGTVFHIGVNRQALAYPEPPPSRLAA